MARLRPRSRDLKSGLRTLGWILRSHRGFDISNTRWVPEVVERRGRLAPLLASASLVALMSFVVVGATLLFLYATGIIGSGPRPCEGCRVPSAVFAAISRDPVLLPLAGATNGAIQGEAQCYDSATQNGVTRTFKSTDRDTKSLISDVASRASRLGWKAKATPLAYSSLNAKKPQLPFAWFGVKRVAGASVHLLAVVERGAIEASLIADCTEK